MFAVTQHDPSLLVRTATREPEPLDIVGREEQLSSRLKQTERVESEVGRRPRTRDAPSMMGDPYGWPCTMV